jgi:hypothetical protein
MLSIKSAALNAYAMTTKQDLILYLHRAAFSGDVVATAVAAVSDLSGVMGTRLLSRVCACWSECGHCPLELFELHVASTL